ncbi:MAG: Bbp16 family capsid cement protein [Thermodesulfobacteriota bacterium]
MTIMDAVLIFDVDRALTAVGSTASTNIIKVGAGQDAFGNSLIGDAGESGRLWLNVMVTEAFTAGTSAASLKVALRDATGATATFAAKIESGAVTQPNLTAGRALLRTPLPADCREYLQLYYTVANSAFTGGKVTSWLGLDSETPK